MNKKIRNLMIATVAFGSVYHILHHLASTHTEDRNIDDDNPYIKGDVECETSKRMYMDSIKPALDHILSFVGLVVFSPIFAIISAAIWLDDPGPILFTQKRIGKNKHYILIHKFRSMKMNTPHDMPTHMLANPEQYITRVGRILRMTSLDELPQIWDIFRGRMSIIGPRPALWNQDDLVAEREKYGANSVLPGLTGLAQIKGRDELLIPEKARIDGEYVKILEVGGLKAFEQDVKCFVETVKCVLKQDGVVEGGTGSISNSTDNFQTHIVNDIPAPTVDEAGFEEYGCYKTFYIDNEIQRKVLITGEGSYIGESFKHYCESHYEGISIDTVDMVGGSWRDKNFEGYDTVFHVAGIAHADVGKITEGEQRKYYEINTDLAIETAQKSREAGVKQFIFMSSMIVYGDSVPYGKEKIIDEKTIPSPTNFYGDSKWQADKRVRALAGDGFYVAVLRPPMIYGKGAKGNYLTLAKLAKKTPIFPDVQNSRSMIYIDNLCEFVAQLVLSGEGGIYFPQNSEYTKTSAMVKMIGRSTHRPVWNTKFLNPAVSIAALVPGRMSTLVNKAFGNNVYAQRLSQYEGLNYCKVSLEESITRTECADTPSNFSDTYTDNKIQGKNENNKATHILIISQYFYPETFRINDIAIEWVKRGYEVTVLTGIPNYPKGKFFKGYGYIKQRREKWNGVEIIRIPLIPRGSSNIGIVANYFSFVISGWWWTVINDVHADIVFTCEVSPMTQALIGCWYSEKHHIPHFLYVQDLWPENVETVTGISTPVVINSINYMVDWIYKHTDQIFTTSPSFVEAIMNRRIPVCKSKVHYWPQYAEEFYKPLNASQVDKSIKSLIPDDGSFKIAFTGNIGTAQGLDILPKVAEKLKDDNVRFVIVGGGRYQEQFEIDIKKRGVSNFFTIIPHQSAEVIPSILACCDVAFLSFTDTSIWEKTIPAKLQSYMACGMPIIASVKGETKRVIEEAGCGLCCDIGDVEGLSDSIKQMMNTADRDIVDMRKKSSIYTKKNFNKKNLMDQMDCWISQNANKKLSIDRKTGMSIKS